MLHIYVVTSRQGRTLCKERETGVGVAIRCADKHHKRAFCWRREDIHPSATHKASVSESVHTQSRHQWEVVQLPVRSFLSTDRWEARGQKFQRAIDTTAWKGYRAAKIHEHARVRHVKVMIVREETFHAEHEGSDLRQKDQQHDKSLPKIWQFVEYKDIFSLLTHV